MDVLWSYEIDNTMAIRDNYLAQLLIRDPEMSAHKNTQEIVSVSICFVNNYIVQIINY